MKENLCALISCLILLSACSQNERVLAPELSIEKVYNSKNQEIPTLESLKGKIIVLDFWATWCSPCVAAFPENNKLSKEYKSAGVEFIGVTDDSEKRLENFLVNTKIDFLIGLDSDKEAFKSYAISSRPTMVVINRVGEIVYQGYAVTKNILDQVVETDVYREEGQENVGNIIMDGGFSPGDDPVLNGMTLMLGNDIWKDFSLKPKLIQQFIIRPSLTDPNSLSKSYFGTGTKHENDKIGITVSHGKIEDIFKFLYGLNSSNYVLNKTGDTLDYDIVYWKKASDVKSVLKEIESAFIDGLELVVNTSIDKLEVKILASKVNNEYMKKPEELEEGVERLYVPIAYFIRILENKSDEFYILSEELKDRLISRSEIDFKELIINGDLAAVIEVLRNNGIEIMSDQRKIERYHLSKKTQ